MSKITPKAVSQFLVFLLMIDAAYVAYGLINGLFVQWFIAAYWVILTAKNFVDWVPWKIKSNTQNNKEG